MRSALLPQANIQSAKIAAYGLASDTRQTPNNLPPCGGDVAKATEGGIFPHTSAHSAASIFPTMRRDCRACSSYSTCHCDGPFDGETCTAVTLYSGQFVAQSV
ncbi:hypothetical protein GA0061100_104503 [Rhizobium hainanense]|uniref:Uncharacterized protein n=1 Tax=Rhizobium hainanense TaxID=52131 RepID=A0A1C3V6V4_9HYPH|nr:hypothetical protein GA0061100_104503 [Rhizobium hainanense]